MTNDNRRNFLKQGAKAVLGVGALGTLGAAAGCATDPATAAVADPLITKFVLNEPKYRQLTASPAVRREFIAALDEVAQGLVADPAAYAAFMESSDAVGSLKAWDANAALLRELVGEPDATTKAGRLQRILTVSELFDGGVDPKKLEAGFLDSELVSSSSSSSSSSSVSSGGDCATNGSATNGCCVIHTWGWSAGDGLCGIL